MRECLNSVSLFLCTSMYYYCCFAFNSHSGYICAINTILLYSPTSMFLLYIFRRVFKGWAVYTGFAQT